MTILRKATESTQSDWRPVPEGLWRWEVGKPEVTHSDVYDNYRVRFPLTLTEIEKERLKHEHGDAPEGVQQSWRTSYTTGLSLGYVQRSGEYKSTKLVDFLAACLGSANQKKFREYIAQGGGPETANVVSAQEEIKTIESWLGWWEGLEVYGTVRHEADKKDAAILWSRFAGPMPVGSLPGQKEDSYQATARGKLRALIAEAGGPPLASEPEPLPSVSAAEPKPARTYDDIFVDDDAA